MKNILKILNRRPIAYYPIYREITGSTTAGVLLSQLMYWFSKKDKFHKTDQEIQEETLLSKKELENAKKKLKTLHFITITREGIPAKTYYEINWLLYEITLTNFTEPQQPYNEQEFNHFVSELKEKYKSDETTEFSPVLLQHGDDSYKVSEKGDLYIVDKGDLAPAQANLVWEYLYNNQNQILHINNKFPPLGVTTEKSSVEQDLPNEKEYIDAQNLEGETRFPQWGKLYTTKGGNSTPPMGETIYSKIKETTTKTTTKTLSPISSLTEPTSQPQQDKSEKREFLQFVNETREKYKGNGTTEFYPVLFQNRNDEIKVSAKGYLYTTNKGDLTPAQATQVWEYLYRNQDQIQHLEPQINQHRQSMVDRVRGSNADSTNYISGKRSAL